MVTTDKLANLIAKRHRCLTQLRDLGRKQSKLIAEGEMGQLLRLISAKNQLIVAVQTLEQELVPFHEQDPEDRVWTSTAARQASSEQAIACRQLLDEIMQLERDNEQQMTERRDQVAKQLQAAQAASVTRGAYQAQQLKRTRIDQPETISSKDSTSNPSGRQLDVHSDA